MLSENRNADYDRCEEAHHGPYCAYDGELILLQDSGKPCECAESVDSYDERNVRKARCEREFLGEIFAKRKKERGENEPRNIRKEKEELHRAGPLGIEPRSSVLETDVLPLNYGPE